MRRLSFVTDGTFLRERTAIRKWPMAGSDASNLKTRAVKKGDRYVINGAKQFIISANVPGTTVLFAVTDPDAGRKGISCFVVDKATPGYTAARREEKLGQKASETCALSF